MSSGDKRPTGGNASAGGCPVDHGKKDPSGSGGCPVKHDNNTLPYKTDNTSSLFGLPASIEESAKHSQSPHPDQSIPLSTHRVVSSIPRADELRPNAGTSAPHQPEDTPQWVYPSEQQFYNAMRRKGWQGVDERTIPMVVRIHNTVNERGWNQVKEWERELHGCDNPRLVHFLGRPNDLSPRAWVHTYLGGNRPFDRHDWYVDRGDGKEPRRYVIDFYSQEQPGAPPELSLEVRPALDSPEAALDRCKMFVRDAFPGFVGLFKSSFSSNPSNSSDSAPGKAPES